MDFRRTSRRRRAVTTLASGVTLAAGGAALALSWQAGLWATQFGAALCIIWIIGLGCWSAPRREPPVEANSTAVIGDGSVPMSVLLDQVPVPLIRIDGVGAHAINRAARSLFATDDRILPGVPALLDQSSERLRHEGRSWRIDAVDTGSGVRLAVLIDVGAEERAAEDRANDEMIEILGHELLNGLSPIVSLADSAVTAAALGDATLPDILATLARRIDGLENFTRAYRTLSRLPAPILARVSLQELAHDLARLFASRFHPDVVLAVDVSPGRFAMVDRDQMTQAIWALLQNGAEAALAAPAPHRVMLAIAVNGSGLTVEVQDSGVGVPVSSRLRIFRPFHTTKLQGSGIGLTLSRRIARAHGGDVLLLPTTITTFRIRTADR